MENKSWFSIGKLGLAITLAAAVMAGTNCGASSPSTSDLAKQRASATEALRAGDCSGAVGKLDPIIAADPADLISRHARASCLRTLQRLTQAIADFRYIADANPTAQSFIDLAQAEWDAGQTEPALAALRRASSHTSDGPMLFTIASTQRAYGDTTGALGTLLNVPTANRDFRWYVELGRIDAVKADTNPVDRDFSKAVAIAPAEAKGGVLAAWGDARWFQGRYQAALDTYAQALIRGKGADRTHIYAQMADCNTKLGNLDEAVSDYRSGLAGNPAQPDWESLSLGLATTLIKLRRADEAASILQKILSNSRISSDTRHQAQALQLLIGK